MTATDPMITWAPDAAEETRIWSFMRWAEAHGAPALDDYRALHTWSIADVGNFWSTIAAYFDVIGDGLDAVALADDRMPGAEWFPNARLNYAENVLRWAQDPATAEHIAITRVEEDDSFSTTTWRELERQVAALAHSLRSLGVQPGDRVAAVLPNIPEAIVAMLASASIGATWAISSPDLAPEAIVSRLSQLQPKVLLGVTGYSFKGGWFDRAEAFDQVVAALPTVEHVIAIGADATAPDPARLAFTDLVRTDATPDYARVPFAHPLWVLFSSGTTGAPKGIVHGHGGMLLEGLKMFGLQQGMSAADRFYVAANTSWMVWNTLLQTLATGASVVCYAGAPTYPTIDRQFELVARHGVTVFTTGAAYLGLVERSGIEPGERLDFSALRAMTSTGSPLPDATWLWVHRAVKPSLQLGSESGGTDVCSSIVGSNPLEPVHLGRLQGPVLGIDVQSWNEAGERVVDEVGEMVITRPSPAMPVAFWADPDGARYRAAYFERFPGVWTHGDWITELPSGEFIVHGRSDATLNRDGVRLGSAEIYGALAEIAEVQDSICLGVDLPDGRYFQPLFVQLVEGAALDDALRERIAGEIRTRASARHVPDEIIAVPAVPLTHAGKRVEVPLKRLFRDPAGGIAVDRTSLTNPGAVDWFVDYATRTLSPAADR